MTQITNDSILIDGPPKYSKNYLVEFIKTRVLDYNKNFMGICCGPTGSGKTYSMIRLGELIDPDFKITNIVFTVKEFIELLNSKTLKRGAVILFDEAGTGINKKQWFSVSNKLFNYILQTFRYMNYVVIFTTPNLSFIDSDSVKLFHCYLETTKIDQVRKVSYVKPKMIKTSHNGGKTYFKFMRLIENGVVNVIGETELKLANKELLTQYEEKKRIFTEALSRRVEAEVTKIELNADENTNRILTDKQRTVYSYILKGYKPTQIAQLMSSSIGSVMNSLNELKKKGFTTNGTTTK